jgi:hypothetical protein
MALQSHFLVAHFPLQAQGLLSDVLSLLTGKTGVLNLLATTCSFEGCSFPAKYFSPARCGYTLRVTSQEIVVQQVVHHLHELLLPSMMGTG